MPRYLPFILIAGLLLVAGALAWFFMFGQGPGPLPQDELTIPPPPSKEEQVGPGNQNQIPSDITGFLAKSREKSAIFWIQNNKKYPIENLEVVTLMAGIDGWDTEEIKILTETQLADFEQGPVFAAPNKKSDGLLLQMKGANYVFTIRDGARHYVPVREFEGRNLSAKDVILVSPRLIKKLPFGPGVDHFTLQEAAKAGIVQIVSTGKFFEEIFNFSAGPFENHTAINLEKGDVLVSKNGKQSLVVTQDFEVFIPRQETLLLEGVLGACIDRFKSWPAKGEVLDVTLNLKDWNLESATLLLSLVKIIDSRSLHKVQTAQDAIWLVTDSQPVKEGAASLLSEAKIDLKALFNFPHLSNPFPKEKTQFILPPELSIPGLVSKLIPNCPAGREANNIICSQELKEAMRLYLEKEPLPSTENILIDARALSTLMALSLSNASVKNSPTPLSQETLNRQALKLVRELEGEGFIAPPLKVTEINLLPDRILTQESALFKVEGEGILEIELSIKDLQQNVIFESGPVFGNMFEWKSQNAKGEIAANGFYTFKIKARGFKGEVFDSESLQLIIRR